MFWFLGPILALFGIVGARLLGQRRLDAWPRQSKPPLHVRAVTEGGLFLEVRNEGQPGEFEAQIEMLEGLEKVDQLATPHDFPRYDALWEHTKQRRSLLLKGEVDRLVIGRVEVAPPGMPPASVFKMAYYDERAKGRRGEYGTTGWIDGVRTILPPRLELRVTITRPQRSTVPLYTNTFVLDADDPARLRDEKPFTTSWGGVMVRHY